MMECFVVVVENDRLEMLEGSGKGLAMASSTRRVLTSCTCVEM